MSHYVTNRRALKVIAMCQKAGEQFEKNKSLGTNTFKEALSEAAKLQTDREKTVCICKLNLAIAGIHRGNNLAGIDDLKKLLPEAEHHCKSILEDIWYYIALALKNSKEGPELSRNQVVEIRDTFYKAKEYSDETPIEWSLEGQIIENLLIFETRESKRCELLERIIWISDDKVKKEGDPVAKEDLDLRMQRACECLHILLKTSTSVANAKAKAGSVINWYKVKNFEQEDLQVSTWCDLGLVHSEMQEYYRSRHCFSRAAEIVKEGSSVENWIQIQHNIAAVYVLEESFSDAINQYTKQLPKFKHPSVCLESDRLKLDDALLHNKDLVSHVYLNLAFSHLRHTPRDMESLERAYEYYEKALDVQKKIKDHLAAYKSLEGMAATVLTMEQSSYTLERDKLDLGLIESDATKFQKETEIDRVKEKLKKRKEIAKQEQTEASVQKKMENSL